MATPLAAPDQTAEEDQDDEAAQAHGQPDDEALVVFDPRADLAAHGRAFALAVLAFASAAAWGPVEEVRLTLQTDVAAELRTGTAEQAARVVAGVCVVVGRVASHGDLALQIPARALPACAVKS